MTHEQRGDVDTLNTLFAGIARLRTEFGREGRTSGELDTVDLAITQLWWRLCRTGVRSGTLLLHHALRKRPTPLPLGRTADLVASQAIGGLRAVRRRVGLA
jgi:hypothetical protein